MGANTYSLDVLLGTIVVPDQVAANSDGQSISDLDNILQGDPQGKSKKQVTREERAQESKGELKRENLELQNELQATSDRLRRAHLAVKSLLGCCALLGLGAAGVYFWTRAADVRALEGAFRVIHYREERAISANAVVLDEWSGKIDKLIAKVSSMADIQDEERARRVQTLSALKNQAIALRDGFLKQLQETTKERQGGVGFTYRDPFLKREIQMNEANGGVINLDQLKEEVRNNANLDATMRSLEEAMANPVPLLEQVRAQADQAKKDGTLESIDLSKGLAGSEIGKAPQVPGSSLMPGTK